MLRPPVSEPGLSDSGLRSLRNKSPGLAPGFLLLYGTNENASIALRVAFGST
jgi:hypothetical protein